jgi:hypothetical protein
MSEHDLKLRKLLADPNRIAWLLAMARAVDNVLVAALPPRSRLVAPPPVGSPLPAHVARYGAGPVSEVSILLDKIAIMGVLWTGKLDVAAQVAPEEPDEAPGLTVEAPPPADVGAEQQARLG